jgi:hypothetical protein
MLVMVTVEPPKSPKAVTTMFGELGFKEYRRKVLSTDHALSTIIPLAGAPEIANFNTLLLLALAMVM